MGDSPGPTFSLLAKVFAKGKLFWYLSCVFLEILVENHKMVKRQFVQFYVRYPYYDIHDRNTSIPTFGPLNPIFKFFLTSRYTNCRKGSLDMLKNNNFGFLGCINNSHNRFKFKIFFFNHAVFPMDKNSIYIGSQQFVLR